MPAVVWITLIPSLDCVEIDHFCRHGRRSWRVEVRQNIAVQPAAAPGVPRQPVNRIHYQHLYSQHRTNTDHSSLPSVWSPQENEK